MLTVDADVLFATRQHGAGIDPALIQAVVIQEGNIIRAVQCSIHNPVERAALTRDGALAITARTAAHAQSDFWRAGGGTAAQFVAFWGHRWAPIGADNDPHNLNVNWIPGVTTLWLG